MNCYLAAQQRYKDKYYGDDVHDQGDSDTVFDHIDHILSADKRDTEFKA